VLHTIAYIFLGLYVLMIWKSANWDSCKSLNFMIVLKPTRYKPFLLMALYKCKQYCPLFGDACCLLIQDEMEYSAVFAST
jgi:hypothetical protein